MTCDYNTIVDSTNKILNEYSYPLTLRQIYYRLVASGLIPNKRSSYNSLSKWLVKAREDGDVDDTKIEDRARSVTSTVQTFESSEDFVDACKRTVQGWGEDYYVDLWDGQGDYLEVWVEKDALSQVIARAAQPFRVTVCPSRGYSCYTYLKRMAVDNRFSKVDKPIIILDFWDHDPSGIQMTEDLQQRLTKYSGGMDSANFRKDPGIAINELVDRHITVQRIALTIEQVKKYDLIPNPTKHADSRSAKYIAEYGDQCWKLDAIPPDELQRLVTGAIEQHIDRNRWNAALEQEQKDQDYLKERFANADLDLR